LASAKIWSQNKCYELGDAESVLSVFGFTRSQFGFHAKKTHWFNELYQQRELDIETAKTRVMKWGCTDENNDCFNESP
jgi:hypothetical protein